MRTNWLCEIKTEQERDSEWRNKCADKRGCTKRGGREENQESEKARHRNFEHHTKQQRKSSVKWSKLPRIIFYPKIWGKLSSRKNEQQKSIRIKSEQHCYRKERTRSRIKFLQTIIDYTIPERHNQGTEQN